MRLIDLDEAVRMVQNSKVDCPETSIKGRAIWTMAHNCALSCLTSCSTIDPESLRPKWISVKDRLPEIPEGWAECPSPVLYMMKSTKTIYAGYYGENGIYRDKYFRQYADAYEGVDAIDVLCWMWQCDLPEPPDMRGDA